MVTMQVTMHMLMVFNYLHGVLCAPNIHVPTATEAKEGRLMYILCISHCIELFSVGTKINTCLNDTLTMIVCEH